jgi:aspartate kinase
MPKTKIGGIMQNANLTKVGVMGVPDRPGVAGATLTALGEAGINVQFIVQCIDLENQDHIICCVAKEYGDKAAAALEKVEMAMGAQRVIHVPNVAVISIFGPDFREIPGIAGQMFTALAEAGINILAISTSISTISCVIEMGSLSTAVQALAETFELP